ncbi:hypothetical protein ABVT39_021106 [Epinephelus coioides]
MAESVPTMDNSDEEEFYDAPDYPESYYEDGKITLPTPQSDYVPPPGDVTVLSADQETVSLGFSLTETSVRYKLQIHYSCDTQTGSLIREDSSTVTVGGLNPGTEYTFSIIRIADNGNQSKATSLSVFTEASPPANITVDQISSESLSLSWDPPAGEVESYTVTCCSEGETEQVLTTDANNLTFSNLKPGVCYSLQVSAQLRNGRRSKPAVTAATTNVPPPGDVTVLSAGQETVSLGFSLTETSVRYKLQIDYSSIQRSSLIREDSSTVTVGGLNPGTEYTFSIIRIADNGNRSKATSLSVFTEPSPPAKITVDQISSESLSLSWDPPAGEVESYTVTCCSEGETEQVLTTDANNLTFSNLKPGVCYSLQVSAQLRNGRRSKPAVTAATTNVPPPGDVTVVSVDQETVSLGFSLTETSVRYKLQIDYSCDTQTGSLITEDSSTVTVGGLNPGTEYTFSIIRIADNGNQSKATSLSVFTEPSPPANITVDQISSESLSLSWDPPAGEVESYTVTCCSEEETEQVLTTNANNLTFSNLKPGVCYSLQVSAQLRNGRRSKPAVTAATTNVPPPGDVTVLSADQETVSLGFSLTETSVRYKLQIHYSCDTQTGSLIREDSSTVTVGGLNPGTEYTFSIIRIADNGNQSKATSLSVFTEPSPPANITVDQISSESLSLSWDPPAGEVESYTVTCCREGETEQVLTTDANNLTFSNLKPGVCYSLQVSAQLRNGRRSKPAVTAATTNVPPPGDVTVLSAGQETVSLGFSLTETSVRYKLQIHYSCDTQTGSFIREDSSTVTVGGLNPGTEYTFSIIRIADNGNQSKATSLSVFTEASPPANITVDQRSSESLSLSWDPPAGEVESYTVTCCSEGETEQVMTTDANNLTFSNLKPGVCYSLQVSAQLRNGRRSKPAVTAATTTTLSTPAHFRMTSPRNPQPAVPRRPTTTGRGPPPAKIKVHL